MQDAMLMRRFCKARLKLTMGCPVAEMRLAVNFCDRQCFKTRDPERRSDRRRFANQRSCCAGSEVGGQRRQSRTRRIGPLCPAAQALAVGQDEARIALLSIRMA